MTIEAPTQARRRRGVARAALMAMAAALAILALWKVVLAPFGFVPSASYDEHIGIVSDRRNASGEPFVIHHWGRLQHSFEEDRLAAFGPIVGHWRWR